MITRVILRSRVPRVLYGFINDIYIQQWCTHFKTIRFQDIYFFSFKTQGKSACHGKKTDLKTDLPPLFPPNPGLTLFEPHSGYSITVFQYRDKIEL